MKTPLVYPTPVRVVSILQDSDAYTYTQGAVAGQTVYGHEFIAEDPDGDAHKLKANLKKPASLEVGRTYTFKPKGKMAGNCESGGIDWAASRDMSPAGNPYNGNAPQTPTGGSGATISGNVGAGSRPVPSVTERGLEAMDLLKRGMKIAAHVAPDATEDGKLAAAMSLTMHWLIGMDRGDIQRDPTPEEIKAAAEEAQRIADEAARAAQAAADAAKARAMAAAPVGYTPAGAPDDDNLPF